MNNTKQERVETVNIIIREIAKRGRGFFTSKKDGEVAYIFIKNNRLFMKNEYNKAEMFLHTKYNYPPKNWHHGGTLWGLVKDFKEFIMTGEDTNHNNGYGGLYCNHWGYQQSDMEAIQSKALELGYLN